MEVTTLQTLIDWIIRVGAMWLAYYIMTKIDLDIDAEFKRYVSFGIGAVIGLLAWGVGIEFGYIQQPGPDWHAWAESATAVVLTIILGAQVAHARFQLSQGK